VQVRAAGRSYDPVKDNTDQNYHFQEIQFDKDLGKAFKRAPLGTTHIHIPNPAEYKDQLAPDRAYKKKNE